MEVGELAPDMVFYTLRHVGTRPRLGRARTGPKSILLLIW